MGDDIGSGCGFLVFAVVQLCTAYYVVYGRKMTLDDNLSLNPNRFHHPLITQLTSELKFSHKMSSTFVVNIPRISEKIPTHCLTNLFFSG